MLTSCRQESSWHDQRHVFFANRQHSLTSIQQFPVKLATSKVPAPRATWPASFRTRLPGAQPGSTGSRVHEVSLGPCNRFGFYRAWVLLLLQVLLGSGGFCWERQTNISTCLYVWLSIYLAIYHFCMYLHL